MQGDVDINIGDGTAVFDMAMHPNTSSNHISAPLIVSNRYNPLDDEELHAESKDEDLNLNVNSNPIIIDHSNTTATTPTTTTYVNITHTDSSSSSNNTSNNCSAQRNSSTVANGVVNSDTNYNNGISIYFNSELPSTITDNKGYKAKQQSLKKLVDYNLKNVCKLSHDDVIDIDEVSYKTVNKSQHLFSIYFGTSAELNRIKSLLQQNHIQLHGASGKTIRGMIGPILLYRCTASVADKLHDHCEFMKVKMDNQNEYAQYEWINFVCPESALASIVSAAKYAAVELHLAVDKSSHSLMVKIKRDQRKFCERCPSIDHFTQHCPSTTMCCRRCRGAHTSNKCDKPFTKQCVLCLQHSYFKKNANTHTYSTCISFHGTEYTIVESDGSAHALPAGIPATPQNKRTPRTVGSRSPTIASLPGNSSSNIRSSNSGGGNVPTYRSSLSSPSSTVVESQSSLVATSASASYASIANPHVSNESNQWMHFMAKQQKTFLQALATRDQALHSMLQSHGDILRLIVSSNSHIKDDVRLVSEQIHATSISANKPKRATAARPKATAANANNQSTIPLPTMVDLTNSSNIDSQDNDDNIHNPANNNNSTALTSNTNNNDDDATLSSQPIDDTSCSFTLIPSEAQISTTPAAHKRTRPNYSVNRNINTTATSATSTKKRKSRNNNKNSTPVSNGSSNSTATVAAIIADNRSHSSSSIALNSSDNNLFLPRDNNNGNGRHTLRPISNNSSIPHNPVVDLPQ